MKTRIVSELKVQRDRHPTLKAALDDAEFKKQKMREEGKAKIALVSAKVSFWTFR